MASAIQYLILGVFQGIFEWLPISSQGVVALTGQFFELTVNPISMGLFLHLGTVVAVLIYFRKDWKEIITFKKPDLLKFLVIVTVISLALGYPLYHLIKETVFGALLLLLTGFGLLLTAFFHKKRNVFASQPASQQGSEPESQPRAEPTNVFDFKNRKMASSLGLLQALSVIPGVSRSAVTIFGLSLKGASPKDILKISYLLSAPVGLASGVYLFLQEPNLANDAWLALMASFLVGILFLHFLLRIAGKINFFKFTLIFSILCLLGAFLSFMI